MKTKNKKYYLRLSVFICVLFFVSFSLLAQDVYYEDFDERQNNASLNGVDSWSVDVGSISNAVTQDNTIFGSSGKAMQIIAGENELEFSRSKSYGAIAPVWIEFVVNPGMGGDPRDVPMGKIGAVYFDADGNIQASDNTTWVDTGSDYEVNTWYRVIMKVDVTTHMYDLYVLPTTGSELSFTPVQQNLHFIDNSISSLNSIGFTGAYSTNSAGDDTYIDDLVIHFAEKLQITSTSQKLVEGQVSEPIIVQLQNSIGETQTAWRDITLELKSSSGAGIFSVFKEPWVSISEVTIPKDGQSISFYYKDNTQGTPIITADEFPNRGWEPALQQQEISENPFGFDISVVTPQIAGKYFDILITAKTESGGVDTNYNGIVNLGVNYFNPTGGTMVLTPVNATGFNDGELVISVMYPDAGIVELTVADSEEPERSGESGQVTMIPDHFIISASGTQIVGQSFQVIVTAQNISDLTTKNYKGPAVFAVTPISPTDIVNGGITPETIVEEKFDEGVATLDIAYNRWGTMKIKVHDESYPDQYGESAGINFIPAGVTVEAQSPASGRNFYYTAEDINVVVSVVDINNQPIPNYVGTIDLFSSIGMSLPEIYTFVTDDAGEHIFTTRADSSGFYYVDAKETATALESNSLKIEVKEATIIVESTYSPIGTTEVTIKLVDEDGNLITSENNLSIYVELVEEIQDFSATSTATLQEVIFSDGIAKIVVSNSQAEVVTINPLVGDSFNIKKGTVTFGRMTKKGIGTTLWREIKD